MISALRASRCAMLVCLAANTSAPVLAKDTEVLMPSSKWQLDYAAESCRLMRAFGEGKDETALIIEQQEPGEHFSMTVAGRPLGFARRMKSRISSGRVISEPAPVSLRFGELESAYESSVLRGNLGDYEPALVFGKGLAIAMPDKSEAGTYVGEPEALRFTPDREAAVDRITLGYADDDRVVLITNSMGEAFAALDKCTDQLVKSWGLDGARIRAQQSAPKALNAGDWLRSSDYPEGARKSFQESVLHIRVIVDEAGEPTSCAVQGGASIESFKETVCEAIIKRARFEPAIDADGLPFPSYYMNTVRFKLIG